MIIAGRLHLRLFLPDQRCDGASDRANGNSFRMNLSAVLRYAIGIVRWCTCSTFGAGLCHPGSICDATRVD